MRQTESKWKNLKELLFETQRKKNNRNNNEI